VATRRGRRGRRLRISRAAALVGGRHRKSRTSGTPFCCNKLCVSVATTLRAEKGSKSRAVDLSPLSEFPRMRGRYLSWMPVGPNPTSPYPRSLARSGSPRRTRPEPLGSARRRRPRAGDQRNSPGRRRRTGSRRRSTSSRTRGPAAHPGGRRPSSARSRAVTPAQTPRKLSQQASLSQWMSLLAARAALATQPRHGQPTANVTATAS